MADSSKEITHKPSAQPRRRCEIQSQHRRPPLERWVLSLGLPKHCHEVHRSYSASTTIAILILHRRTLHRTVRAKDTALPSLRSQQCLTFRAFVKKLACVCRHRFTFGEAANGTHKHGLKNDLPIPNSLVDRGRTPVSAVVEGQEKLVVSNMLPGFVVLLN